MKLVKSKVQVSNEVCRVGIKIRANPANTSPLINGAIILAVPPDIKGESVKTSHEGSVWDGMKRVVAWPLNQLEAGQLLEVQARFEFVVVPDQAASPRPTPKFPVLVRCDATNQQFSGLQVSTEFTEEESRPVTMQLVRTVRVLHRKV